MRRIMQSVLKGMRVSHREASRRLSLKCSLLELDVRIYTVYHA
jgi:hypothetical protein